MGILYKICDGAEWQAAAASGHYQGSAADHRDGFIHLSAGHQVRETAARHFAGQHGLLLVAFDEAALEGLKWEPSRSGALFPHVYGEIPAAKALWVKPLPLSGGTHQFPQGVGE